MRAFMVLGAVLVSALSAASQAPAESTMHQARAERPSDPPIPAKESSPETLRAWVGRFIDKGTYVETDMDGDRLYLYDPTSLVKLPDGHVVGMIRAELFRPRIVEGQSVRSVRKKVEIDCGALRYKEIVVEGFAGSNLQRPVAGLPMTEAWTKPAPEDSGPGKRLRPACSDSIRPRAVGSVTRKF